MISVNTAIRVLTAIILTSSSSVAFARVGVPEIDGSGVFVTMAIVVASLALLRERR